ncbi:dethiobiotin synthase [Methylotenera sp. 1P/1]|jgi:dethiobiotin synthetase|uniref:dethiobiotin synthase n=1 Tax=Methylotenera sp. 1P/1 TaxID=1131551 RepID=UPI000360F80D|nr:dethiobiotin synthase [Methylotenera sp. 1P/1]
MKQAFFITGTDTGIGKTFVACQLIRQYVAQGYRVVGMKPIAAGCDLVDGQWVNEDVKLLMQASNVDAPLHWVNPYCFKAPIAPHIAAQQENIAIQLEVILQAYQALTELADIVVVEGAGGLLVPLHAELTIAELAAALNIPIIFVVGMRLGCINHALLSLEVMQARHLPIQGWVANPIDPAMQCYAENLATLQQHFKGIPQLQC